MVRVTGPEYPFPPTRSESSVVRRLSAAFIAALLAAGMFASASFAASSSVAAPNAVPKVVFIVGPAGAATSGYRAQARAAATIARHYTPDVVELYSPDATWPAVKQALAGASLVVYMGHGNGWPSPYRNALFPPSQDGFGLNPAAGGDDATHQYFGEGAIATQIKLAKNAVVLLNHLCYASGNSEPGLLEGTLDQARQRVDNYAAGFIHAGASAVVADARSSPSYMVKAILGGGRSIQAAWQDSPSANGHRLAFASRRSTGYVAQMDTESATSGFTRSIVMKAGLAPKDVLAGAAGSALAATPALSLEPTLVGTGIKLGTPDIINLPSVGTTGRVDVPFTIKDRKALPKGLQASVRWDPIDVAIVPADPASEVGGAGTATGGSGAAGGAGGAAVAPTPAPTTAPATTTPSTAPTSDPSAAPTVDPTDLANPPTDPVSAAAAAAAAATAQVEPRVEAPADNLDLVVPEQVGDVVAPVAVGIGKKTISVPVTFPPVPGRYRLTVSLHDADGVAYDAASQAMIPSLSVRVTGDFDGAIQAAPTADLTADTDVALGVRVVNLGRTAWGHKAVAAASDLLHLAWSVDQRAAYVVGRWIPLSVTAAPPTDPAAETVSVALPIGLKPGVSVEATLGLTTPSAPGQYLLLLDIVTPERGSLVASGADPTLVRVVVLAAPTP